MPETFIIDTGALLMPNSALLAYGYAGAPGFVNDPSATHIKDKGPIPVGEYDIGAAEDRPDSTGPFSLPLTPRPGTDTFGRSGFFIHGDSREFAGQQRASDGCIILARFARERIAASPDKILSVIASYESPLDAT